MAAQTVQLTDEQQEFIAGMVSSGQFPNAQEIVSAGLRMLEPRKREYDAKLAVLRAAIDEGDNGGFTLDSAMVFAELRARIAERAETKAHE